MKVKIKILSIIIIGTSFSTAFGQIVNLPNYSLKNPETLEILKVEQTADRTLLYLSVENRIEGGAFCADKNIFLLDTAGLKYKLNKSTGIPVCPESYKFQRIGEKLQFTLEFPPLKQGTKWFDLIEECNSNCFSIYGITLDINLNKKLDEGFSLAEKGENSKAISIFKEILNSSESKKNGIDGALYTEIISMEYKSGNLASAKEWYNRLISSHVPRLLLYVSNLNSRGIKF